MTDLEHLQTARDLIADESHWTQNYCGRDKCGNPCGATDSKAVQWCAYGALEKVGGSSYHSIVLLEVLSRYTPDKEPMIQFNNNRTHAEVIKVFDEAISDLRKEK